MSVRDLSGTAPSEGGDYALVPPGPYTVFVEKTEERTSAAGNEWSSVWFKIVGGPCHDRYLFDGLHYTEKGLPVTVAKLQAAGIDTNRSADFAAELVGKGVNVIVKHKAKHNGAPGEMEEKIVAWEASGAHAPRPASADPWGTPAPQAVGLDDDIPF